METVFSGIQPTGELHLGNYLGAVRNWLGLQEQYRCFFCVVDYHAITQVYDPMALAARTLDMATDLIACGITPERSVLFVQSGVPEHTELCWILSTVATFGDLSRMTQFKDKSEKQPDNINLGLFSYPVLQAADILLYDSTVVPVGMDQLQHLELAREIVRKFNARHGDCFAEPRALLSATPKILGLDGQAKMSKSLGNTIALSEDDAAIRKKLSTAATDPARVRRKDPGNPANCNLYTIHTCFSNTERLEWVRQGCTGATIGCLECKNVLADVVIAHLGPIREKRNQLAANPSTVRQTLLEGATKARETARATLERVRRLLGIWQ
ncbi:MAG: tryptophan--tRNA ligase [Pseudomonadota bacterium]